MEMKENPMTDKELFRLIGAGENTPTHIACRCFVADLRRVYEAGLAANIADAERYQWFRENLSNEKQIVMLREALVTIANLGNGYSFTGIAKRALSATLKI
jgi:hypothetical protein